jgi:signal transduction histidine kinase/ligand-binding sensor domain-containing protein
MRPARLCPLGCLTLFCVLAPSAFALDPHKSLTQYSRTVWTQADGLPQDTIGAICQTTDGYLWLGTDEGLARFDGYRLDLAVFTKDNSNLPTNSIRALAAGSDGSLWIGTSNGLAQYKDKQFHVYTTKNGLPDEPISALLVDHTGIVWIVAGVDLARFDGHTFSILAPRKDLPLETVRAVYEDRHHTLWVGGFGGVLKREGNRFVKVVDDAVMPGDAVTSVIADDHNNLWIAGSSGVIFRAADGKIRKYDTRDGLPDLFVRAFWLDRDGNIWAGTNDGLARLQNDRFTTLMGPGGRYEDQIRSLFEDSEGNLWVGANDSLSRLRDDIFTVYGKTEGLPSDEPNTVYQDHAGRVWVGFHDSGLMLFSAEGYRVFTERDGLPGNEVFSIRENHEGDLLVSTRGGLARLRDGKFSTFRTNDPLQRYSVYDSLEDSAGRLWLAVPNGLGTLAGNKLDTVIPGGQLLTSAFVSVIEGRDGTIWAGTYGKGLWQIRGKEKHQFTTADGLPSDSIRALYQDREGTLWIGTFDGGLGAYRDGRFTKFRAKDGLLSDNIASITDDGQSLWLGTTRGICRITKQQLEEFAAQKIRHVEPVNYGVEDGLRSAQCAPGFPLPGGGVRSSDGRLWFPTSRGVAVFDPNARRHAMPAPAIHLVDVTADGRTVDLSHPAKLAPGSERIRFQYTAIHLSAPDRIEYWRKLEGFDPDWVRAGARVMNYNNLPHGTYRFLLRAEVPGAPPTEAAYAFELLPEFYETAWFRVLCVIAVMAAGWAVYQLRLRQIRYRFALVLEERARLAREIHDTLAQGFVGISSQLDVVAMAMPEGPSQARQYLDLARKMARHSLTEARRSVMDLRASVLEGRDLAAALNSGAQMWVAGSGVQVEVDVSGVSNPLPENMEQHLLRIAQEAVTNVLKHAGASKICVKLHMEARKLYLRIADNGRGFEEKDVFSSRAGHFGLIGMRERAERLGGELRLASHPGEGTQVEVTVPLP